jgi:hypothetical protein
MAIVNGIQRDRSSQTAKFTITDFVEDFDWSSNAAVEVIADGLATLIRELARQGIINADITA